MAKILTIFQKGNSRKNKYIKLNILNKSFLLEHSLLVGQGSLLILLGSFGTLSSGEISIEQIMGVGGERMEPEVHASVTLVCGKRQRKASSLRQTEASLIMSL